VLIVALAVGELWVAGRSLDYNHPTLSQVFTQAMPTLDYLRTVPGEFRVLSVAQDTFAPAVEPGVRQQYGAELGEAGVLDYLRDYKLREILEPNTTMAAGVPTIDGYDGGLLPLGRYVRFKDQLTELESAPDDRIRFVIKWLPNRALLDLAGVRYVLTDALTDKTAGGVSYDLSSFIHLDAQHPEATLTLSQPAQATSIGMVVASKPVVPLPSDRIVATLTVADDRGDSTSLQVPAGGSDLGQLPYREQLPDRLAVAKLDSPLAVKSLTLALQAGETTDVFLNGLALIDEQAGTAYSPLVAPGPEMRKVYQGDVKLYENPAALPPAFLVHDAQAVDSAEQAAAAMGGNFDPAAQAVIEANPQPPPSRSLLGRISGKLRRLLPGQQPFTIPAGWLQSGPGSGQDRVRIDDVRAEQVAVTTDSDRAGFLVLSQSFYPGWEASIDGAPAQIVAADSLFQAVHLAAGQHRVEFSFRPRSLLMGEAISLVAVAVCLIGFYLAWSARPISTKETTSGPE